VHLIILGPVTLRPLGRGFLLTYQLPDLLLNKQKLNWNWIASKCSLKLLSCNINTVKFFQCSGIPILRLSGTAAHCGCNQIHSCVCNTYQKRQQLIRDVLYWHLIPTDAMLLITYRPNNFGARDTSDLISMVSFTFTARASLS